MHKINCLIPPSTFFVQNCYQENFVPHASFTANDFQPFALHFFFFSNRALQRINLNVTLSYLSHCLKNAIRTF